MTTEQIIESLNRDRLIHIDVIEAIRRGRAAVVYAASDALLLHTEDWLHLLVCDTVEAGVQALSHCDAPAGSIVAHSDAAKEAVQRTFPNITRCNGCWQALYPQKSMLPVPPTCTIVPFPADQIPFILAHYDTVTNPAYFAERIQAGAMFAAYVEDALAGFIGFHDDGSMGMLEVLPTYRRLHIGTALESHLVNDALRRGWTPYCQIFVGNTASVHLQQRLGLVVSQNVLYWMHSEE